MFLVDRASSHAIEATDVLRLNVVFPHNNITTTFEPLEDQEILDSLNVKGAMSLAEIHLKEDAEVMVEGFGIPFSNAGQPVHEWLRFPATTPVFGDMTFLDILKQDKFTFLVQHPSRILSERWNPKRLSSPFSYPYGTEHCWDMDRYRKQIYQNKVWLPINVPSETDYANLSKGHQYQPAWGFDDNNSHMAAVAQSQVQDVFWLHEAATDVKKVMMRGYFVESSHDMSESTKNYAIVRMPEGFLESHATDWRRLTQGNILKLDIHYSPKDEPLQWNAMIVGRPGSIEVLEPYPLDTCDLVLRVVTKPSSELPLRVFENASTANAALQEDTNQ